MFRRILFICVGNICRSPMAEAVARQALAGGAQVIELGSAGVGAVVGAGAHPISAELMQARGLDIEGHLARQLTAELVKEHELILTMEKWQVREVERLFPTAKGKVFRLGHWSDFDIPDPNRRSREMFVEVLKLIDRGVADLQKVLAAG